MQGRAAPLKGAIDKISSFGGAFGALMCEGRVNTSKQCVTLGLSPPATIQLYNNIRGIWPDWKGGGG